MALRVGVDVGRADDHRGGRLLLVAAEVGALRHDDVDARRLDARDRLDGAGDLAFQRAHAGDLLHEGGQAERADIVEQLVAGIGAGRQALLGKQHARLRGLAGRHQHRGAVGGDVEADAGLAEHQADLVHVGAFEADIERLVGGAVEIDRADADDASTRAAMAAMMREPARPETLEIGNDGLDLLRHWSCNSRRLALAPDVGVEACAKMISGRASMRSAARFQRSKSVPAGPSSWNSDRMLWALRVGDRQRLDAELLLDLQRLQAGRFLVHVGIDELADAALDGVHQAGGEALLQVDRFLAAPSVGGGVRQLLRRALSTTVEHLGDLRVVEADDGQRRNGVAIGRGDRAGDRDGRAVSSRTPVVPRRSAVEDALRARRWSPARLRRA